MPNGKDANHTTLPDNPNLDHLKGQAKALLKSFCDGDKQAQDRMSTYFENDASPTLAKAQLVLAREYGFSSWETLRKRIEEKHKGRLLKNRFLLESRLGSGPMGDVYKALDLRQKEAGASNPYLAIKLLNEAYYRDKDALKALQREASRTRGIHHPNVMAVYDFDREGDTCFMSMPLEEGEPLDEYLRQHREDLSQDEILTIIDGICRGLMAAHDTGTIHCDFKPGNVFYTVNRVPMIFDFGVASGIDEDSSDQKAEFRSGSVAASTTAYISYERLTGAAPTIADDVFSLAITAYELLAGKHPFGRLASDKALGRDLKVEAISSITSNQWQALSNALEIKVEDRTKTVNGFHDAFFNDSTG